MTARPKAWVCTRGLWRKPFLDRFLPEYELTPWPTPGVRAVIGWGARPTAGLGRAWAKRRGLPFLSVEDGLLRSVGLGEAGAAGLSVMVDDLGAACDAARPSRLEHLIETADGWCVPDLTARARALIDRIVESGLSKTNLGAPLDPAVLQPGRRVLIVDQTAGDAAIAGGLAGPRSFAAMAAAARRDEPGAQLIVKRHPATVAGRKAGALDGVDLSGMTVVGDVAASDLLGAVDAVYAVTSGLGFEALLRGLPVRLFGAPFYAGWGLTRDEVAVPRRGAARSLEQVAAAALIRASRYVDPVTGAACEAEAAVERLIRLRDRARRLRGDWSATGFAPPKRQAVRRLMNGPQTRLRFHGSAAAAAAEARRSGGRLMVWGGREGPAFARAAEAFGGPAARMEDGFLRSRGLGSNFAPALSAALDETGVYYDPSRPSALENLIQTGRFDPRLLGRAARLRAAVVGAGLSKYNLSGAAPPPWPDDRERILVVGQVEDDRSVLLGCDDGMCTNAALLRAVRAAHPDAFLIYRDHPDVRAGNRIGRLDAQAASLADGRADDLDVIACIDAVDAVAALTSLSGFEALLRGRRAICFGRPFYAGWGLTEDHAPIPRRTRRATLDELTAAALILYPLYVTPQGWPCEAEDMLAFLSEPAASARPARGGAGRWPRGLISALDRRRPPSY